MALEPITREEKYLAKAAGQSVEVPEPITRKEMFLDAVAKSGGGSSGGGASSWNDLTDKPFGEEQAFEPIVWDGNIEGREVLEHGSKKMVHISSLKITDPTNIENLVFGNIENGETATVTDFQVRQQVDGAFELQGGLVMLVNNTSFGVSEGVWAMLIGGNPAFIAEINPKSTIKPLDEKYLPESVKGGGGGATSWDDLGTAGYREDTVLYAANLEVDGDMGMALVATPFNLVPGKEYQVIFKTNSGVSTDTYKCIAETIYENGIETGIETGVAIGNTSVVGGTIESEAPFVIVAPSEATKSQTGISGMIMPLDGGTCINFCTIDGPVEIVNPIPERYLPEKLQGFGTVFLYAGPEGEVPDNSSYRYLYNSADTTNAANRVTREEALAFVHSGRAIYLVDSGGDGNVYYLQLIVGLDNGEYVVLSTEFGDQIISYCTAECK